MARLAAQAPARQPGVRLLTADARFATAAAGLRFVQPETERLYREWRVVTTLPYMRLGMVTALGSWVIGVCLIPFWDPAFFHAVLPHVLGYVLPVFLVGTWLGFRPGAKHRATPIVMVMQTLGGFSGILLSAFVGHSMGGAVVWCLYVLLFFPFMRTPPDIALLSSGPYTAVTLTLVSVAWGRDQIAATDAFIYSCGPALAFTMVMLVCAVLERMTREAYVDERTIEMQRQLIRRYVPPSVAARIEHGEETSVDAPQRREVTVLFSDVVGFTGLAERLPPEMLTRVIGEYMSTMADIVEKHGGTLNEFAGDGVMALFGAPAEMAPGEQVANAVAAACAMQSALPKLNEEWSRLGIGESVRMRIGINTGEASVGSFGSQGRMTYTAIGLQTNVASRIQSQCTPGGILLSEASWQLVKDRIACDPCGEVEIRGAHFPVKVYAPLGVPDTNPEPFALAAQPTTV